MSKWPLEQNVNKQQLVSIKFYGLSAATFSYMDQLLVGINIYICPRSINR